MPSHAPFIAGRSFLTIAARVTWVTGLQGVSQRRSLAEAAVDALAQQVGVAEVPGVLLDHVGEDVAQ